MSKKVDLPFLRSEHNYDGDAVTRETALSCPEVTRTQQHFAAEADINTIVRRFGVTGVMPVSAKLPTYGDFTGIGDYQSALAAVQEANEAFAALDAELRARFKNDPAAYVEFCSDPANLPELRKLGLAEPEAVIPESQTPAKE